MGRPCDKTRDLPILDATPFLLTEVGYEQLFMEAVANRFGAAKPTIYGRGCAHEVETAHSRAARDRAWSPCTG